MDTEEIRQLLINMGSELDLDDEVAERYQEAKRQGLVVFREGKIYKTEKGRKAVISPDLIRN